MKILFRSTVARMSVVMLLLLVLAGTSLTSPKTALAYSCGTPDAGHCYGIVQWPTPSRYFGSVTEMSMVPLRNCSSPLWGCMSKFVDDEMWLQDISTPACLSNPFHNCWVEAGHTSQGWFRIVVDTEDVYFWADVRPGSGYFEHDLTTVPESDYNSQTQLMIIQDGRQAGGSGTYQVYLTGHSTFFNGTSTSNSMTANLIAIGQELAGDTGMSAPLTNFTANAWAVRALGPEYVFWQSFQTTSGNVVSSDPPVGRWLIRPETLAGGNFETFCC